MSDPEANFGTETSGNTAISPVNAPGDHAACDVTIARLRERAEAAEEKLAAIRKHCRAQAYGNTNMWEVWVSTGNVLAIIGDENKGGAPYDRDFDGPVL